MPNNISVEINGSEIIGAGFFKSVTVTKSIEYFCGTFSFECVGSANLLLPIKVQDKCVIKISGQPIITGVVEKISVKGDKDNHTINISGRDRTLDIIDSKLGAGITFKPPISLIQVVQKILSILGLTDIKVSSNIQIEPFKQGEIISSEVGISAFDYIEKYAKKRQVFVMTDGNGNIFLDRSGSGVFNEILNTYGDLKPNVKSFDLNLDYSKVFYHYILNSQANPGAMKDFMQLNVTKETHISSEAFDNNVRHSRVYNFVSDTSEMEGDNVKNKALWIANTRRCDAFKYSVIVSGFISDTDGLIWAPNNLVNVIDPYCDINSQLLISSVTFNQSLDGGSTTKIEMVDKDSFTIKVIDSDKRKKNKKGRREGYGLLER